MSRVAWLAQAPFRIPGWFQAPGWIGGLSRDLRLLLLQHQAGGLFLVILVEEMGFPLPVPGDIAILWGGYMTATGRLSYGSALLAVVAGATLGATILFTVGRRYGHGFLVAHGKLIGLSEDRLERAQNLIRRWGALAIIFGRLVPGMRIWLSALAGSFEMPYWIFVPSVAVSATLWATIFLELGRRLGPRAGELFRLLPVHLLPWVLLMILVVILGVTGYRHGLLPPHQRPRRRAGVPRRHPGS